MGSSYKKVDDILHDKSRNLGTLLNKVVHLQKLEEELCDYFDDDLLEHVRLGSYQQGKLILLADSAAFGTKLKFYVPTLISKLRQRAHWAALRNIEVKVAPHLYKKEDELKQELEQEYKVTEIPESAKERMHQLSLSLKDTKENKQLKEILDRLSK